MLCNYVWFLYGPTNMFHNELKNNLHNQLFSRKWDNIDKYELQKSIFKEFCLANPLLQTDKIN